MPHGLSCPPASNNPFLLRPVFLHAFATNYRFGSHSLPLSNQHLQAVVQLDHRWRASSAPQWNPQNTDQPRVLPSPDFSAEECVRVQLDNLSICDDPWPSHGIHLAYEFGFDIGGLDPSMYFGFPKDLYHLDHFMGIFQNKLPELVNLSSYEIMDVTQQSDDDWQVKAKVSTNLGKDANFTFHMKRKKVGSRKGALMTAMIIKEG